MAITKTTKVQRCEVYPKADASAEATVSAAWPTLMVVYEDTLDDAEDNDISPPSITNDFEMTT